MSVLFIVFLFVFNSFLEGQSPIDPEIQMYFETQYGYMKSEDFRNSPVSTIKSDLKTQIYSNKSIITYTVMPQPDYTSIPLHYDIKQQNTSGSISSYVLEPKDSGIKIKSYVLIDVAILKKNYSSVIQSLSDYGFIYAGEENFMDASNDAVTLFGWIDERNFSSVSKIKNIEKISISGRDLRAPLCPVTLIVKVPNNRDLIVFSDSFVSKLSEYGFVKNDMEIISSDKKYRFSIIKINGMIPLDKTRTLLKYPFVIEAKS